MFSNKSFIVSGLTCWSLIHFDFISVYDVRKSYYYFFGMRVPISPHLLLSFFLTCLLEYNCYKMVCYFLLFNKMNQLYIHIYPHISSLLRLPHTIPITPLQMVTKHRADLPVLCGCFPLAIYFTFCSVYMSMPLSHFIRAYIPLPVSSRPFSMSSSLFLYCPQVLQNFFFFQIPYICVSIRHLFFSF